MKNNQGRVTVRRIEKVPTKYYAQIPQPKAIVNKRVKVEVADSLLAQHKRLTDALRFTPAIGSDYSGSFISVLKTALEKLKTKSLGSISALMALLKEERRRLVFAGQVSFGVAAAACLLFATTCSVGYAVTSNGRTLGILKNKAAYRQMLSEINWELKNLTQQDFSPRGVELSACIVPKGRFSDATDVKEELKATDGNMLPAYAVYANGEVLFALPNEKTALSVLDEYKEKFTNGDEDIRADFCEEVTVSRRFVPREALKTAERATQMLSEGKVVIHDLAEGETLNSVAQQYNVTVEDLIEENNLSGFELDVADSLKVKTDRALLSVVTKEFKEIKEEIPFNTIEKEDPTRYEGMVYVEQEGAPGTRVVEAFITCVNGVEQEREILSDSTLSLAVDRVVKKGTKEAPPHVGTGKFAMPTKGTLTSRFGQRWGRNHNGIDVAASVGTNIYAADNGTVVYSEFNNGGYGYMIQIDHGNGMVTYYSHCNELFVPEGSVVAKGDLIATVGNTGRSTGPHLHFEVRQGGTPVDPMAYLNSVQ